MCWDVNITIKNNGCTKRQRAVIEISFDPPRTSFPPVKSWYHGQTGSPTKMTPDGRKWQVEFTIDLPPGESVHVGWDFENSVNFSSGGYRFISQGPRSPKDAVGALALSLEPGARSTGAWELVARNPSDSAGMIRVHRVAVATHTERLHLDNLITGDPVLESLEWKEVIAGDAMLTLGPGDSGPRFRLPLKSLAGIGAGLARTIISDPRGETIVESFYQCPPSVLRPTRQASRSQDIVTFDSVRTTRDVRQKTPAPPPRGEADCCFTALRFKKLYPGDMTVTLATDDGRTVTRRFTSSRTVRTAFVRRGKTDNDDDNESGIVAGGLGRCVTGDVSIVDTSSQVLAIAHYQFQLCCGDRSVRPGNRVVFKDVAKDPLGQTTILPLLQLVGVVRVPCPD